MKSRIEIQPIQESPSRREKKRQSWRGPLERVSRPLERWSLDPGKSFATARAGISPARAGLLPKSIPARAPGWAARALNSWLCELMQPLERPKPPLERVFNPKPIFLLFFIGAAGCPRLPPVQFRGFNSSILRRDRSSEPSSMVLPGISP